MGVEFFFIGEGSYKQGKEEFWNDFCGGNGLELDMLV